MLHGFDLLRQQYVKYASPQGAAQSPEGTVKVLAERLADDSLAADEYRGAVMSLKALSRDHAALVSRSALVPLLRWIQKSRGDGETLRAAVECCLALCQVPADAPGNVGPLAVGIS